MIPFGVVKVKRSVNTNVGRMPLTLSPKYLTRIPDVSSRIKLPTVWQFIIYDNFKLFTILKLVHTTKAKKKSPKYISSIVADCAQYLE